MHGHDYLIPWSSARLHEAREAAGIDSVGEVARRVEAKYGAPKRAMTYNVFRDSFTGGIRDDYAARIADILGAPVATLFCLKSGRSLAA